MAAACLTAVLLAHGLALQVWAPTSATPKPASGVVQLRILPSRPGIATAAPDVQTSDTAAPAPTVTPSLMPDKAPMALDKPAPSTQTESLLDAKASHLETPPQPSPAPAQGSPLSAGPALSPSPPGRWRYQFQMGGSQGEARLSWQHDGQQYQARLERELPGRQLPVWVSQGQFRDEGLAPDRFATRRREREREAINFRRDRGQVSFSAVRAQLPLPEGVQDRLSWMLQLAAQLEADPQQRASGRLVQMPVMGLRGEPMVWSFIVRDTELLPMPQGPPVQALRLEREGLGPYEDRLEVWMDPARHFLPVKLRQWRAGPAGELGQAAQYGWEMLLIGEDSTSAQGL